LIPIGWITRIEEFRAIRGVSADLQSIANSYRIPSKISLIPIGWITGIEAFRAIRGVSADLQPIANDEWPSTAGTTCVTMTPVAYFLPRRSINSLANALPQLQTGGLAAKHRVSSPVRHAQQQFETRLLSCRKAEKGQIFSSRPSGAAADQLAEN
jgi:hypothetical protein